MSSLTDDLLERQLQNETLRQEVAALKVQLDQERIQVSDGQLCGACVL